MAQTLSKEIISAAIEGFEAQQRRIAEQLQELRSMLDGAAAQASTPSDGIQRKRKFSADAIRRMREAQQKRWAKVRGQSETAPSTTAAKPPKKKRKLSAAGRKAIQEALRKRWAAKKAESQPAAAKKASGRKQAPAKATAKAAKRGATRDASTKKETPTTSPAGAQ